MNQSKPVRVIFQPGCFDDFEGTQQELDKLQQEIQEFFQTGQYLEQSQQLDIESLLDDDPELADQLLRQLDITNFRKLQ